MPFKLILEQIGTPIKAYTQLGKKIRVQKFLPLD